MLMRPPVGWALTQNQGRTFYLLRDGTAVHIVHFSSFPKVRDSEAYGRAAIQNWSGGNPVTDEGTRLACNGLKAHVWGFTAPLGGVLLVQRFSFVPIYAGVGVVWYGHTAGAVDRPEAIAALGSICPGAIPLDIPDGWTKVNDAGSDLKAISADNAGRLAGLAVVMLPSAIAKYDADHPLLGTIASERRETCAGSDVRIVQSVDATRSFETAIGYLHGFYYRNRYERPLNSPPDPAVEADLTGFCRDGWPYPNVDPAPDPTPAATYAP